MIARTLTRLAAAALLAATSFAAMGSDESAFVAGRWLGHIEKSGQPVAFQSCAAAAPDLKRTSVTLGIDRDSSWRITLGNPGWHIPKGWHYQLRVSVDGAPTLDWDSVADSATLLTIALGTDQTILTLLRRGHSLQVTSGSFRQSFSLEGTDDAIGQLIACQRHQLAAESASAATSQLIANGLVAIAGASLLAYVMPLVPIAISGSIVGAAQHATATDAPTAVAVIPPAISSTRAPPQAVLPPVANSSPASAAPSEIELPLEDLMGTFVVPVRINDTITLKFTVDSGASTVVLTDDVVGTLERAGTISASDYGIPFHIVFADGSQADQRSLTLHTLGVGGAEVTNVTASVGPKEGSLLLGQSFLGQFDSWSIDNARHVLILRPKAPSHLRSGIARLADQAADLGM